MPKEFEFSLEDNIKEMIDLHGKMVEKILPTAVRRSLNKGMGTEFGGFDRKIRSMRKIKKRDLKRFITKRPAISNVIDQMQTKVKISGRKVGLINFVSGKREGRSQKGVPVRKRRKIRVEIRPGKKKVMKSAFIAKGKGGKNQVFRRRTKNRMPIVRQAIESVARLASRENIAGRILMMSRRAIRKEYGRQLGLGLSKHKTKGQTQKR